MAMVTGIRSEGWFGPAFVRASDPPGRPSANGAIIADGASIFEVGELMVTRFSMVLAAAAALAVSVPATSAEPLHTTKSRVLILSDIGNEPDDSESLVRLLLYANEFDVEGLVATTSTWQRTRVQPQLMRERVEAYGKVLPNLRKHARGYPDASTLMAAIVSGTPVYGMAAVGEGKDTEASRRIIEVVDRPDDRPVYIPVWGGSADLAQALWTVRETRTPEQVKAFVSKLRIHSISDQDDTGAWARRTFPDLFWIASVHGWGQYGLAAWIGIAGDLFRRDDKWPNADMVTNEWLEANIRRGPLGALYPPHEFIMEGDTPSFLGLIPNGLNNPENPEWGGWGGRYLPIYEGAGHRADASDRFVDANGKVWASNQATVFRWRGAFQNDFAGRMAWTLSPDVRRANHHPELVLSGVAGKAPVTLSAKVGATVRLSAAGTHDRDGDKLTYRWWQYAEPSQAPGVMVPPLEITGADSTEVSFTLPMYRMTNTNVPVPKDTAYHIILEVTDSGSPPLTSYRRAVVTLEP
ncbi:DUF1593 domain-containing protein [Sphingobium xanthum]|uniref:DUF1593 domain-containing protein n=2 Tax=Sphingobium TaxID=165695 RepID=UPI0017E91BDA|nr:DUF1593 domain-containing protein [Sphingobium xanthum]MCW2400302.1 hypothetical protein [Sphingobium sp. B10D7B]